MCSMSLNFLETFLSAENGVSPVAVNLEQLNIHIDDQGTEPEEESSDVLIPNHLQLHTPECFSLSFGSFGSKQNAAAVSDAGTHASRPLQSNLDEASGANDVSTIGSSEAKYVLRQYNILLQILVVDCLLRHIYNFLAEMLTIMGRSILLLLQMVI